ncbi:hypothetical protein C8R46DRAFT_1213775 [Mycena filopes]|nr:hypothetical protein C8R46DRAFT_1213775 [Mycena filopes]
MSEPPADEFESIRGPGMITRKIWVTPISVSFSAHVDFEQNSEFIELVKARHVVSAAFLLILNGRPRWAFEAAVDVKHTREHELRLEREQ